MTQEKKTRSELKREAIVNGAMQAFQLYGVTDTSMDKIAELAQVSKRTVYNHFASKELLVTHIIKQIWSQNVLAYEMPYNPDRDVKEQLLELIMNELQWMSEQRLLELVRVAVSYCLFNPQQFTQDISDFFEQETALMRWLKQAMQDGKLKQVDLTLAYEQLLNLLKGQAFWPQLLHQQAVLTEQQQGELAQQSIDFFLSYYQA